MVPRPIKVTIAYCSECGYQPQALEVASALLYGLDEGLLAVELVPWHDGTFDVLLDGVLMHSMGREGGFPVPAAVVQAVRDRLRQQADGPDVEGERV
jgi:selenoprotein W-related protein